MRNGTAAGPRLSSSALRCTCFLADSLPLFFWVVPPRETGLTADRRQSDVPSLCRPLALLAAADRHHGPRRSVANRQHAAAIRVRIPRGPATRQETLTGFVPTTFVLVRWPGARLVARVLLLHAFTSSIPRGTESLGPLGLSAPPVVEGLPGPGQAAAPFFFAAWPRFRAFVCFRVLLPRSVCFSLSHFFCRFVFLASLFRRCLPVPFRRDRWPSARNCSPALLCLDKLAGHHILRHPRRAARSISAPISRCSFRQKQRRCPLTPRDFAPQIPVRFSRGHRQSSRPRLASISTPGSPQLNRSCCEKTSVRVPSFDSSDGDPWSSRLVQPLAEKNIPTTN